MLTFVLAALLTLDPVSTIRVASPAPPAAAPAAPVRETPRQMSGVAVTLECTARVDGQVTDCQVLGETHPGMGFGEAAIALMQDARVEPGPRDIQFARTIQFRP